MATKKKATAAATPFGTIPPAVAPALTPAARTQMGAVGVAQAMPDAKAYRILSIDGGGIRGIVALAVLEKLDAAKPGWRDGINMFAGTSTGALIGLSLAKGMSPQQIMDVYMHDGPKIFERSLWHEVTNLGEITGPKYDGDNRQSVCRSMLGNDRLRDYVSKDGTKGHVLAAAFNLHDQTRGYWKAKIFHNMPTNDGTDDGDLYAWRVAMSTSAAPTYFPAFDGYIDGGVFANNPAMCAIAQTQDPRNAMTIPLPSLRMLSLGTGFFPKFADANEKWGLAQWAPKIISLMFDGVNEVDNFEAMKLLGRANCVRVAPQMPVDIALDDTSQLGLLQQVGNNADIAEAVTLISSW
jgi:uncharacterized protein